MKYDQYPIFCGITQDAADFLNGFDKYLLQRGINIDARELMMKKIELYFDWLELKRDGKEILVSKKYEEATKASTSLFLLYKQIYSYRRYVKNTPLKTNAEYHQMITEWQGKNTDALKVSGISGIRTGWIYKTATDYKTAGGKNSKTHRYILNVHLTPQLLEELDRFAIKYNCRFKCAEAMYDAYTRPDSVLIYTANNRIKEQIADLKKIVSGNVRDNGDNLLDGDKVCDGLFIAEEATRADIQELAKKMEKIYPRLSDFVTEELNNNAGAHPLSLGQYTALKDICDSIGIQHQELVEQELSKKRTLKYNEKMYCVFYAVHNPKHPRTLCVEFYDKDTNQCAAVIEMDGAGNYRARMNGKEYRNAPGYEQLPPAVLGEYKIVRKRVTSKASEEVIKSYEKVTKEFPGRER